MTMLKHKYVGVCELKNSLEVSYRRDFTQLKCYSKGRHVRVFPRDTQFCKHATMQST